MYAWVCACVHFGVLVAVARYRTKSGVCSSSIYSPPWYLPHRRFTTKGAHSNTPLRGGKLNFFEGGVRPAAFVTSPLLPKSVAGSKYTGMMHETDWFATFAALVSLFYSLPSPSPSPSPSLLPSLSPPSPLSLPLSPWHLHSLR